MRVLGLSAFVADSAAALVDCGRIVAAAQEERFSRIKHDPGFPTRAASYCLAEARCRLDEVDLVAIHGSPASDTASIARHLAAMGGRVPPIAVVDHHVSHAASAFYPSPFPEAAILVVDGGGAGTVTASGMGSGNRLDIRGRHDFPHSLGLLYSAFTFHCGFRIGSGEYKLMGLAPYGAPRFAPLILEKLVHLGEDGEVRLDPSFLDLRTGTTNDRFAALFGGAPRQPDEALTGFHMDLAASIQAVTERGLLNLANAVRRETGARTLCMAGAVALNCVANGKLARAGIFDRIWIQPAAGDCGGALGAALAEHHRRAGKARRADGVTDCMQGAYLGPAFDQDDIERRLATEGARFVVLSDDDVIARIAALLAEGKAVGWMRGRMEFGPRALGNRSILGDPRSPSMQRLLNLKVKYRESFRPFAPAVLREDASDWFAIDGEAPYMLIVAEVRDRHRRALTPEQRALTGLDALQVPRSDIPAVTHVDYSARVQTVSSDANPDFHALLSAFKRRTGCGVLVNTSFNVRGEPIVCTPEDAFGCFMGNEIEALVVGNCFLMKHEQDCAPRRNYRDAFLPD